MEIKMMKITYSKLRYRQFMYCIFALFSVIGGSIHSSWSSPYLPQLKSENSPIGVSLTTLESSLVVSSLNIGGFLGCIFTIWGFDMISRKAILTLGSLTEVISWIFICFANSSAILIFGRIIGGLSTMAVLNCAIIYNAEISDKDNRGKMGFLYSLFGTLGSLLSYVAGPYMSYKAFSILAISVSLSAIFFIRFIPESPYYLIKQKQYKAAEKSIRKICSNATTPEEVHSILKQIKTSVETDLQNKTSMKDLFSERNYRKPLFIHWSVKVFMYLSGYSVFKSYMQTIIQYSGGNIPLSTASVIFGIFNIVSVLISSFVVDKFGRKPLLIISTTFCGISNAALATYFYLLEETTYDLDSVSWLPLTTLVAFEIFVAVGLLPIPFMIGAELYPMNIKGMAVSTVGLSVVPLLFLLQMAFEFITTLWGTYTMFYIFTCFCFVGTLFGIFIFPETKGKTFDEIKEILRS